ncbi:hypothetical protein CWI36_0457p0010 [Hamiltosporidium magnivora]|uniref:Uncharacterized protein n=1 Tax=Hamiltosporidium magnivora TaxID=148818 RepID=A0A4Q9LFJ2_9MICR|nr:hypothetical protein CWI36_0457p0010 [Hamiltosporidium magnivora]
MHFEFEFLSLIYNRIAINERSKNSFILFMNTLDLKYLYNMIIGWENSKGFCFILDNLKKKIDEIVFYIAIYSMTKIIPYFEKQFRETLNLYYNLFIVNLIGKTAEVFINLDLKYKLWEIECLIGYNIDFYNCSITFKELDLKLFTTKNITKENKIGKIVIRNSKVYSDFLKDIFAINELKIFNVMTLI